MTDELDGLISFFGSHHAIRAEAILQRAGFTVQLIPGPKDLSPNCGVALRIAYAQRETLQSLLLEKRVQIDSIHNYRPRTDNWPEVKSEMQIDQGVACGDHR